MRPRPCQLLLLLLIGLLADDVRAAILSDAQRTELLKAHNTFRRRTTSATDMKLMRWDCKLEDFAANHLKLCNFTHSSQESRQDKNLTGFDYIGENLHTAWDSRVIDLPQNFTAALCGFWDEIKDYTYITNECVDGKQCGHYTQMVWANSYAVGCAITRCKDKMPPGMNSQVILACTYGPGGNIGTENPYKTGGEPCSGCTDQAGVEWSKHCVKGLCSDTPEPPALPKCSPPDPEANGGSVDGGSASTTEANGGSGDGGSASTTEAKVERKSSATQMTSVGLDALVMISVFIKGYIGWILYISIFY